MGANEAHTHNHAAVACFPHTRTHTHTHSRCLPLPPEPRDYEANPKLQEDPALLKRVRRLTFAHINGLEAFSMYAPAILACKVQGVSETTLAKAARVYLFLRTLYNVSWAIQGDSQARSYIRTVVWTASVAVVGSLYLAAARAK